MRKIESLMVQAIKDGRNWKSSNTEVISTKGDALIIGDPMAWVYLHNNQIAEYNYSNEILRITNAGWRTVTTKSRLNAIINGLLDGTKNGVYQQDYCWYVIDHGRGYDFDSSDWYSFKSNALDVTHSVSNTELIAV